MGETNLMDQIGSFVDEITDDNQSYLQPEPQQQQQAYTREDEHQARKRAQEYARNQVARERVNQEKLSKAEQALSETNALKAQIARLESMLTQQGQKVDGVQKQTSFAMDRFVTEDVLKDENDIINDPVIGKYYDRDKVRQFYLKAAEQGKHYTPYEGLAITNFLPLAKKIYELEAAQKMLQEFRDAPLAGNTQTIPIDELSNVNDESDIRAYQEKAIKKILGGALL